MVSCGSVYRWSGKGLYPLQTLTLTEMFPGGEEAPEPLPIRDAGRNPLQNFLSTGKRNGIQVS
jgi:hypothetical protein